MLGAEWEEERIEQGEGSGGLGGGCGVRGEPAATSPP